MQETNYDHIRSEIRSLKLADQLHLLEEIASIIRKKTSENQPRSILKLKGKGKDIWKAIDVKDYLNEERSSWNG